MVECQSQSWTIKNKASAIKVQKVKVNTWTTKVHIAISPKSTSTQPMSKANARATNPKEALSYLNAILAQMNRHQYHNAMDPRSIMTTGSIFLSLFIIVLPHTA